MLVTITNMRYEIDSGTTQTRYETKQLPQIGAGGQGNVFAIDHPTTTYCQLALKVYHEYNPAIAAKLKECLRQRAYDGLTEFSTPPNLVALNSRKQVIGYTMQRLTDYQSLAKTFDLPYCVANKITIRRVAYLYARLQQIVSAVHAQGFVIGDIHASNVCFKVSDDGKPPRVMLFDVDSWKVDQIAIHYACTATHSKASHPEVVNNLKDLRPRHDWYSFAHQLAHSLIKCDPFESGRHPTFNSDERKEAGLTCWDQSVPMDPKDRLYYCRFGAEFTNILKAHLSGHATSAFPLEAIEKFGLGLIYCPICKFEFHQTVGSCPRCMQKALSRR